MIEIIYLNSQPVRVTGFRQTGTPDRPEFEVVIQIPGEAAERDFAPLLADPRQQLTITHPDGREERHLVTIAAHQVHRAGPAHAPLYRHQLRLVTVEAGQPAELGPVGEELAVLLTRFNRLLDALDAAGVVSRAAVERRASEVDRDA